MSNDRHASRPVQPAVPGAQVIALRPRHRAAYGRHMERRRQEILATTWELIAEYGSDQFKLSDLSERCGVALRTIYNGFTDKDSLIAEAVATHYHSLFEGIGPGAGDSRTLDEVVAMMVRVAREISSVPAFSATAARLYYATRTSSRLVETLRRLPISTLKSWIRSDEADRKLIQQFGREALERSFANLQWGSVNDWVAGRIDDAELVSEMQKHMIAVALGFGNRTGRAAAKRLNGEIDA
jgi:AcrR family transcriptional regulator